MLNLQEVANAATKLERRAFDKKKKNGSKRQRQRRNCLKAKENKKEKTWNLSELERGRNELVISVPGSRPTQLQQQQSPRTHFKKINHERVCVRISTREESLVAVDDSRLAGKHANLLEGNELRKNG